MPYRRRIWRMASCNVRRLPSGDVLQSCAPLGSSVILPGVPDAVLHGIHHNTYRMMYGDESTYIILFPARLYGSINDNKMTIFTHQRRASLARFTLCWLRHNRLMMTSQLHHAVHRLWHVHTKKCLTHYISIIFVAIFLAWCKKPGSSAHNKLSPGFLPYVTSIKFTDLFMKCVEYCKKSAQHFWIYMRMLSSTYVLSTPHITCDTHPCPMMT